MNLSEELRNELLPKRKSQIDRAIEQLEGDDRRDFIEALNDPSVSSGALSRVLARRGIVLDQRRIAEYRSNGGVIRYGLDGKRVSK